MTDLTRRVLSSVLASVLTALLSVSSFAAGGGFSNFVDSGGYRPGQFRDVNGTEWFATYVGSACNYGLFKGKSADAFDPGAMLTLGEAVTLAARIKSIYDTGRADFIESDPYYKVYADYAIANGIIKSHGDYDGLASRVRFAELIYNALPPEAFTGINAIPDYAICDVMPYAGYGAAIYALYRAGVLTGADRFGTFYPDSNITRAEVCAIMVRTASPAARVKTMLPVQIPAEIIFRRSTDAVFLLETFDESDKSIRTATGFFISGSGLAVTNLHVIENAANATITLSNGDVYPVLGVCATDEKNNLIIFSIDSDNENWSYLDLADSDLLEAGNTVYALGSPLALINTITEGVISRTSREVDGQTFIQFSAPISFGSGGSPVLNTLGQVIGVASSSFSYGQNLNLAIPVNFIKQMQPGECIPLKALLQ